ncbi:phosphatidylethanolamine-binding protein [Infundibulicybe gibba]|nr:phosphatidylethanolamine-binding protein [Infundibulicybe gibba]
MFSLLVLVSLAVAPFVSAQSNELPTQIAAIEAHFNQAAIVPAALPTFKPTAILTLNFPGVGNITAGQALKKEGLIFIPEVGPTPDVLVTSASALTSNYTIAMIDVGTVGSDQSKGVTRHWLVNSVAVAGGKVTNTTGTAITAYAGPGPAPGSGAHRYVVLLLAQPSTFAAPQDFSQAGMPVGTFDFNAYVKSANLGDIVAGNYFTVEDGTATASVSATSAVVSSTLVAAAPSGSSGSGSKTSAGASATSSTSPTGNGASGRQMMGSASALLIGISMIVLA